MVHDRASVPAVGAAPTLSTPPTCVWSGGKTRRCATCQPPSRQLGGINLHHNLSQSRIRGKLKRLMRHDCQNRSCLCTPGPRRRLKVPHSAVAWHASMGCVAALHKLSAVTKLQLV